MKQNQEDNRPIKPPPKMSQSIVEIMKIIGPEFDYKKTLRKHNGERYFMDNKGTFQEMDRSKEKGVKTIAE